MTPLTEEEYYNMAGDYLPYKGMLDTYANSSYSFYETYCDDVISKKLNKNSGYMKPCLALLKYSYTVKDEGSIFHITIPCNYLNIWLKDQIKIIPGYIFDVLEFYNILNSHNLCKSVVNGLCNGKISNIDDGFFNNFQILLTLYDNLNKYRNNLFDNDLSKCEYLDICADSYEEQVKVCNSNNPSPFCNELKKFKEQYNRDMKSEHDCKELKKKILLFPGEESHKLYEEVKSECESELDPEPEPEPEFSSKYITKRIHCDALKDIYSFYSKSKLSELKCTTTMSAEEALRKIQERESTDLGKVDFGEVTSTGSHLHSSEKQLSPSEEASSPSDTHNAMAITFPLLGVLSIFYSLYKFTPVGYLINSRFMGNKVNSFNINEGEHELLENEFDYEHMNVSVGEHGIGYHPVQ
ncbi:PIR Superfamily Protein [Plasmodium ovale wallikeri]|uniref:PIR Superfamily Protein n=1 Tax=Plasmodium ovale wallikeri TaxID=864142 RepID=A0A1A9ACQ4_PLAOA|nr:PIR Superfamily Protein [Plasmodium ovale wallikeri]